MAGKVKVNGTTYNIISGKARVAGVMYSVKQGKSRIQNTVETISLSSSSSTLFTMYVSVYYILIRGVIATIYVNNVQKDQLVGEYYEEDKNSISTQISVNAGDSIRIVLASKITSASLSSVASYESAGIRKIGTLSNKTITGTVPSQNCYICLNVEGS